MMSTKAVGADTRPMTLQKTKSPGRLQNYDEKLQGAMEANAKLKELLQAMRNNALARKIELNQTTERVSDDQQVARLRRKEARLTSELQQLTNNLNVLVSENGKLKAQVDVSRNSRVIYSNVYKTIEKEIRKHEYLYKLAIIDCLSYEEVHKRAADRLQKTSRRIEKDISELQGSAKPLRKKDKRKSRLDTGLSSYRLESKDTCRCSNEEAKTARQDQARNPSVRQTALSKRDPTQRASNQRIEPASRKEEAVHEKEKAIRSRGHLLTQQVSDYYEMEMKSNYYDNLMKHLREITGQDDLRLILNDWQQVDTQIQTEYSSYLQLQREAKAIREQRQAMERQLQLRSEREIEGEKTVQEEELAKVTAELEEEKARVTQLQERLTALIDINSSRLSDEEISQHVQRIKRRGDSTNRQLEKLLESVTKEKSMGASRVTNKSRVA